MTGATLVQVLKFIQACFFAISVVVKYATFRTGNPTDWIIAWFVYGVLALLLYRFGARGPANPFGEETERFHFWFLLFLGPFGFLVALYSTIDHFFEVERIQQRRRPTEVRPHQESGVVTTVPYKNLGC